LMVLKILAISGLVVCGLLLGSSAGAVAHAATVPFSVVTFGAAMTPVLFAYGGWQTASFVANEMTNPKRDLKRAMIFGVIGVVALYVSINCVYLWILVSKGLADSTTPASTVMERILGVAGSRITAVAITVSTLGFLSQAMLTAPRVYFSMAADGLFFRQVATVSQGARVPVVAIVLQGICATVIAIAGAYEQILNYVVSVDFFFIGLTAASVLVFRKRDFGSLRNPLLTVFFVAASWWIVFSTIRHSPFESGIGLGILLAGLPAYAYWKRKPAAIVGIGN
jgi:basic amino acid/polyamine antiporter, APA family